MLNELQQAIISEMKTLPGINQAEEYAGQLELSPVSQVRAPAILVHFGEMKVTNAAGFGTEFEVKQQVSAFLIVKHARGATERAQSIHALLETVLPKVHNQNFMEGADRAQIDKVVPNYILESSGLSVREIRWTQNIIFGESAWDGTAETLVLNFNDEPVLDSNNG